MSPRRRLASKAHWSCMSAAYRSTIDRSCHPIRRIRSPSEPPPAASHSRTCAGTYGGEPPVGLRPQPGAELADLHPPQLLRRDLRCRRFSSAAGAFRLFGNRRRREQGHGRGPQWVLQVGLGCGLRGARSRTRHAELPPWGERYRDTRQQSNVCSAELLDQSSSAFAPTRRVFVGQTIFVCAGQD
jgi:hypothetical protein